MCTGLFNINKQKILIAANLLLAQTNVSHLKFSNAYKNFADVNNDGKVDYLEFTERFSNPARDIGFNLAVLLTNLKEHITNDPRLGKMLGNASSLLEYFDPFLGRIEIMGSSKRVEKIYFEIQE